VHITPIIATRRNASGADLAAWPQHVGEAASNDTGRLFGTGLLEGSLRSVARKICARVLGSSAYRMYDAKSLINAKHSYHA